MAKDNGQFTASFNIADLYSQDTVKTLNSHTSQLLGPGEEAGIIDNVYATFPIIGGVTNQGMILPGLAEDGKLVPLYKVYWGADAASIIASIIGPPLRAIDTAWTYDGSDAVKAINTDLEKRWEKQMKNAEMAFDFEIKELDYQLKHTQIVAANLENYKGHVENQYYPNMEAAELENLQLQNHKLHLDVYGTP